MLDYPWSSVAQRYALPAWLAATVEEGLRAAALPRADVRKLPSSDPGKVVIALAIRDATNVTYGWIAAHLQMRSAANVSQILRRAQGARGHTDSCGHSPNACQEMLTDPYR